MNGTQSKKNTLSCEKCILIATVLIFAVGGVILGYLWGKQKTVPAVPTFSTCPSISSTPPPSKEEICDENDKITYTTFSSPKADFTFEYPSDWVYDEEGYNAVYEGKEVKTVDWGFYPNLKDGYKNRPPYLAVSSPTDEVVDFYSAGYKGTKFSYQLNVFLTNDSETCVTYEQYEGGGGYIYWQKGECFASSANITDIYYKVNLMVFYSVGEGQDLKQIGEHIAKSIKIK